MLLPGAVVFPMLLFDKSVPEMYQLVSSVWPHVLPKFVTVGDLIVTLFFVSSTSHATFGVVTVELWSVGAAGLQKLNVFSTLLTIAFVGV